MFMIHHILELRGVNETKEVVFYEENSGMRAARGVWFLEYFGHANVKMLDGGIHAWTAAGAPVTRDATVPQAASFKTAERREVLATADDVLRSLDRKDTAILDTRSAGEHFGTVVRAARGGAIPHSIHIEWTENLDADGKFKSNADLRAMYGNAGITPDKEIYSYCQGGYRAAHSYIAPAVARLSESAQLHRLLERMGRPHRPAVGDPKAQLRFDAETQSSKRMFRLSKASAVNDFIQMCELE
jgi:thiosulfate/3-mercaptopyruvate sulfurtransferase